jgi:hypothetical protein
MSVLGSNALAGPRISANYNIATDTSDLGATRSTSAAYLIVASVGDVAGVATVAAPAQIIKHGYIAQLYDITGLTLTSASPTVNETATVQLAAWPLLDDDTILAVAASDVAWSVQSGPLASISTNGLGTAGTVYQNTGATAQGTYGGQTGILGLTVLETLPDNFGTYAGDGLGDPWQVQYFGLSSTNGAPGIDFDFDGIINLFEFAFGTDPTASGAGALQYNGTLAGGGTITATGQPTTMFESPATGIDFRALFVRRVDFVAANLTYTVQFSADLNTWFSSTTLPTVLADNGLYQIVSVPYPPFLNGKNAGFFRLNVSIAP